MRAPREYRHENTAEKCGASQRNDAMCQQATRLKCYMGMGQLFRQSGHPQRSPEPGGKRWRAIHTCKLPAKSKVRLQFNNAGSGGPRFAEPAQRDERPDQDHIIDTVPGIGLHRAVGGLCRLIRSLQMEVSE